jgi:undecaprenyl-phosphate 4-deoxy-4-formamido-L-arabinose transferase
MDKPYISVVVPVYNSEKSLAELQERIDGALSELFRYEVIYVNDGSKDGSLDVLLELRRRFPAVSVINRKKNRGQHEAVILGLRYAKGRLIVNLDDDLQHDPAFIPVLVRELEQGAYDIVYAAPKPARRSVGGIMRDALFDRMFNKDPRIRVSSFRVYTREQGKAVLSRLRGFNYFSALVFEGPVKARSIVLPVNPRKYGASNYSIVRLGVVFVKILIFYRRRK